MLLGASPLSHPHRLGHTILSAYTLTFQTHIYSTLPPSFSRGFKQLINATFDLAGTRTAPPWIPPTPAPLQSSLPIPRPDLPLWSSFEQLGMLDRYESLISSVCYEHIEAHILETCTRKWGERMLQPLREWMTNKIVPWMVMPYARGARTGKSLAHRVPHRFRLTATGVV